ncbi:signal protein [Kitasatospora sp. NPDC097643]|uniref:signal protein n=1 Tax=Kitasatospora sp. NPDC097643 TaxID=3157230 RepID=UPI00331B45A8
MKLRRLAVLCVGALALTVACTSSPGPAPSRTPGAARGAVAASPSADDESPEPSPTVAVHALTSAELQSQWWSWAAAAAENRSPVLDQDGHLCGEGQKDGIWFLAGTTGGPAKRSCTVPIGVPVVFPLVNVFGTSSQCLDFMDTAKGGAVLDGKQLTPEPLPSTPIRMYTGEGNPFTGRQDSINTWSCGLWVRLDPLTPGSHVLSFHGESGDFATAVDYRLEVAKPTPTGAT